MTILEVLIVAAGVSIDAFAVSIGGSLCSERSRMKRNAVLAALFFGGFQVGMPLIGYGAATLLRGYVAQFDHWLAFALLALVGGKMFLEGWQCDENRKPECPRDGGDFFAPSRLVIPAVATSLDALAVGAGLFFAGSPIAVPAAAMGIVTAVASAAGVAIGTRAGTLAREGIMLIIGGIAIILIGVKILLGDLLGI